MVLWSNRNSPGTLNVANAVQTSGFDPAVYLPNAQDTLINTNTNGSYPLLTSVR